MKLRIISDLHLDHYHQFKTFTPFNGRSTNTYQFLPKMEDEGEQVLVIAGDLFQPKTLKTWTPFLDQLANRFKDIVIVMGNHDYWGGDFVDQRKAFINMFEEDEKTAKKFHVLTSDLSFKLDDYWFFGETLWSDLSNPIDEYYASKNMNDYRFIEGFTTWIQQCCFEASKAHLELDLSNHKDDKVIVVTHHAPSFKSVAPRFRESTLNSCYCSNLEKLVEETKPILWIHGHVHNHNNYMIGETRVISNPYGYYGEKEVNYNPFLVIEV